MVGRVEEENLKKDKGTNDDETEGIDPGGNLLQVTSGVVVLTKQRGDMSEEGIGTSRDDDTLGLTLFTGRAAEKTEG